MRNNIIGFNLMYFWRFLVLIVTFGCGVICGGYLFSESIPRSFLAVGQCGNRCYKPNEVAGLITSAAILKAPFSIPKTVLESDTCLAIRHPKPEAKIHFVLFPKRDIKNITMLTPQDTPYVLGCFALARQLVEQAHISNHYSIHSNGPNIQKIAYLHFHLLSNQSITEVN